MNVHDNEDILVMIKSLLTEKFTMGSQVEAFEKAFAEFIGAKYAIMVNSGSSANLLALSVLSNHKCTTRLNPGDEFLVPVVCWSTSVFPIIQNNLIPIFVDVDPKTLNVDLKDLEKKITKKTKAIMAVHVLGNSCDMDKLMEIIKHYNLLLIEDTCESLGSQYRNKHLGTFGNIGCFSYYYSHHLTTGEGGMIVTNDEELYDLSKVLRAHGWTRQLSNKDEIQKQYPDLSPQFTFCNLGYNLRPMEIQGAMGLSQLSKLKNKNDNRKINYQKIQDKLKSDSRNTFLSFPVATEDTDAVWFGIILFLKEGMNLASYMDYLTKNGVENRCIVSGNFVRQPIIRDLYPKLNHLDFPGGEECHKRGLFIGLSCNLMSEKLIEELVNILLGYMS